MSEAFAEVCGLALRLGARSIKDLPGCWEHQIDAQWWVALNGHNEPIKCSSGVEVPPYTMYVMYNGWPAGLISPAGGTMAAGAAANEDTFIAVVKAAGTVDGAG